MVRQIVDKAANLAIVLIGSLFLVFSITYLLPTDVVDTMLANNAGDPKAEQALRQQLGLDVPFHEQFIRYISNIAQGDFGTSAIDKESVIDKILTQFPATIALTIASVLIAAIVGIVLGILAAIYRNTFIDYIARVIGLVGISMPAFWTGILLIIIFSIGLGWFPAMGSDGWKTLVLPATTLGLLGAGFIVRIVRNSMLEVLSENYIATLRAKGLSEKVVLFKHALRNAIIPALTIIGILIGDLLGGAVVIETVFARQGIGRLIADAIVAKDIAVVQGVVFFIAIIYVVMNLIIDISYSIIDPRIRRQQVGG